ncbi:uncharacterized protein N7496_001795 [Penicillium cataractarum]|uniref:Uncharacterized protein n=1 Tax=Penicillium cataractarum TaxID=2100454 RepID=A0A9X0B7E2_9EURO|nr:uncharacterized protein N7496_001795 [Penicillium cataractarum]KAJ5390727.1 hypothetical protein N7496_001795 [Penicillium cataractarum]
MWRSDWLVRENGKMESEHVDERWPMPTYEVVEPTPSLVLLRSYKNQRAVLTVFVGDALEMKGAGPSLKPCITMATAMHSPFRTYGVSTVALGSH